MKTHHFNELSKWFNTSGLTAVFLGCFLAPVKPLLSKWFKLLKMAFKLIFDTVKALFTKWFKLLLTSGLNQCGGVYI